MALHAGVDIIMLSEEHYEHSEDYLDKQLASLHEVRRAVLDGTLPIQTIDAKLGRIITLKQERMRIRGASPPLLSLDECREIERRAARGGVCLIHAPEDRWPIDLYSDTICVNATPREAYARLMNPRGIGPNQAIPAFDTFRDTLGARVPTLRFMEYDEASRHPEILETARVLLIVTEDYPLPGEDMDKERQQRFVRDCLKRCPHTSFIIGLRSPYELLNYSSGVPYLCAYSSRSCSAREAARLIASGERPPGIHHIEL